MTTNRRSLFACFAALPFMSKLFAAPPKLASSAEILESSDARDWARHFVAHAKAIPGLAIDEDTMTGWFANAIMRGYDERQRGQDNEVREAGMCRIEYLEREALIGAVARGWCSKKNSHKSMDVDLANAIVAELEALGSPWRDHD